MINLSENVEALESIILTYILYRDDDYVLSDVAGNHVEKSKLINALQPSFFTSRLNRDLIDQIKQFFKKYTSIPSKEELEHQFETKGIEYSKIEFDEIFNTNLFKFNNDYLYENLHAFLVVKTINSQFNKVSQHLALTKPDPDNIDKIFEYVRNELSTNLEIDITSEKDGLDVYDFHSHIQPKKDTVSTGFGYLDLVLGGGWEPKTLVTLFGRPKIGKCIFSDTNITVKNTDTQEIKEVKVKDIF